MTVTRVADGEGDGYSLSLDYGKVALVTNGIDATGKPSQNGEFGYDVANKIEIAPFTLALNPGHAPVANAQSISTDEDTATAVTLSGSDADGDSLTFAVVSGPAHGTLSGSGANLTYTPDPDYNGPDAFTYVANDGTTDSEAANVSLTVQAAGIHIVKFVNGQDADSPTGPHVAAGSTVTFTYVVTNTGNVPLANVAVTDDKLGPITSFTGDTNGDGLLDTTETWTYTADRHRPGRPADQRRHRHRPGRQHRDDGHRRQPGQLLRRRPGHQHRQVRQRPGRRQPDRAARGRRQHGDASPTW